MANRTQTGEKRAKRVYRPEEKAHALATLEANNGNVKGTARDLGIPAITLRQWAGKNQTGRAMPFADTESVSDAKSLLADTCQMIARKAWAQVDATLRDAKARDAAVIAGIATDKMLLLRGDATVITSTADKERSRLLAERYAAIRPAAQQATITFAAPDPAGTTALELPEPLPQLHEASVDPSASEQIALHSDETATVESAIS